MTSGPVAALEWFHQFSDPLAWAVLVVFFVIFVLERRDHEWARHVALLGWVLFGVFWLSLIYHFVFVQKSIVEGLGSIVAVPASIYVGYLLWQGRDSLFVLSRAVVIMGAIYFPFETIGFLRQFLVETVTWQVEFLMTLIGIEPTVIAGDASSLGLEQLPYRNTFLFTQPNGHNITYTILLACTGIGSMSIFAALVLAVEAPLRRKFRALAIALPIIYVLNLVRNVFIAVTFGKQLMHLFPDVVMTLFSVSDPYKVSYYLSDRILAQVLSVVALVGITYLVVQELPEILTVVEDLLYLVTGSEYDLQGAIGEQSVRADGGQ
jgi:archaeosortase A (PGF-CTERM-specific)